MFGVFTLTNIEGRLTDVLKKVARGRSTVTKDFTVAVRQSYDMLVGMHSDGLFGKV